MIIARIRMLMEEEALKVDDLARVTGIGYTRWANVLSEKAKIRHEEIEALGNAFPAYRLWLAYGDTLPKAGQIMPAVAENAAKYSKD